MFILKTKVWLDSIWIKKKCGDLGLTLLIVVSTMNSVLDMIIWSRYSSMLHSTLTRCCRFENTDFSIWSSIWSPFMTIYFVFSLKLESITLTTVSRFVSGTEMFSSGEVSIGAESFPVAASLELLSTVDEVLIDFCTDFSYCWVIRLRSCSIMDRAILIRKGETFCPFKILEWLELGRRENDIMAIYIFTFRFFWIFRYKE